MVMMPKRVKYRKTQRGSRSGMASRAFKVDYGQFGLQALERAWISTKQIEAARIALTRHTKRKGKVWIRVYPDKPVTKKPAETRMGKGKGPVELWVAVVRPGNVLFEMDGVPESLAREAFRLASTKLPISARFITRR